jgi:hypothetical protein
MDSTFTDLLDAAEDNLTQAVDAVAKARDYAHKQASNPELDNGARAMAALSRGALARAERMLREASLEVLA